MIYFLNRKRKRHFLGVLKSAFLTVSIKVVLFCRKWTRFCGDSCVLSSANDIARFMLFLLGNGTAPGSMLPLVSNDEFSNMFKPWNRLQSPSIEEYFSKAEGVPVSRTHSGVALGFKTGQYRGTVYLYVRGCRRMGEVAEVRKNLNACCKSLS